MAHKSWIFCNRCIHSDYDFNLGKAPPANSPADLICKRNHEMTFFIPKRRLNQWNYRDPFGWIPVNPRCPDYRTIVRDERRQPTSKLTPKKQSSHPMRKRRGRHYHGDPTYSPAAAEVNALPLDPPHGATHEKLTVRDDLPGLSALDEQYREQLEAGRNASRKYK